MHTLFTIILLMQPASAPTTQPATPPPSNVMGDAQGQVIHRGAPFLINEVTDFDTVMAKAAEHHDQTVRVSGTVGTVCRKKRLLDGPQRREAKSLGTDYICQLQFFCPP